MYRYAERIESTEAAGIKLYVESRLDMADKFAFTVEIIYT